MLYIMLGMFKLFRIHLIAKAWWLIGGSVEITTENKVLRCVLSDATGTLNFRIHRTAWMKRSGLNLSQASHVNVYIQREALSVRTGGVLAVNNFACLLFISNSIIKTTCVVQTCGRTPTFAEPRKRPISVSYICLLAHFGKGNSYWWLAR